MAQLELHCDAIALLRRLSRVLGLLNLSNQQLKCLADVLVVPCARLGPAALEFLRQLLAFFGADLALLWPQIALVTYNDDGNGFGTLGEWSRHVSGARRREVYLG